MSRKNLEGLVDTCFEEGHYEAGINALEHQRTLDTNPTSLRIRQLLYIALFPPNLEIATGGPPGSPTKRPLSPTKGHKQSRMQYPPSLEASSLALRYLSSVGKTASLEGLFGALPSYARGLDGRSTTTDWDEEDSYVGRESACIETAKNVWVVLREGFLQSNSQWMGSPTKPKRKKSHKQPASDDEKEQTSEIENFAVIGDSAWPVLDWLICLFERDEKLAEENELVRHSPNLLNQIPLPRGPNVARWEVDATLEVIFHCLRQPEERRNRMGVRLLTCLINLWYANHLDTNMLVASVLSKAPIDTADEFSAFVSNFAPSAAVSRFKIALCQKHLNDVSQTSQATAAPRRRTNNARPIRRSTVITDDSTASTPASETNTHVSVVKVSQLPSTEITRLTAIPLGMSPLPVSLRVKFELVLAFVALQDQLGNEKVDLEEWKGSFESILDANFSQKDATQAVYLEVLKTLISS